MRHLRNFIEFNESVSQNSIDLKLSSEFGKIQDYLNSKKQSYKSDKNFSFLNSKSVKTQILDDLIDNDFDLTELTPDPRDKEEATPITSYDLKVENLQSNKEEAIKRRKRLSQEVIHTIWERLAKQGINNADNIIGTRDTIDNIDFDKFWSNVTKEDLQNLKKSYETQKQKELDLYNKFKGEFDPTTGTFTSNDTSFFDNKIKDVVEELKFLSQQTPPKKNENISFEKQGSDMVAPSIIDKIIEETNLKKSLIKEYSLKIWKNACEILKQIFTYPLHLLKKYLYKLSLVCGYKFDISNLVSLKATISFLLYSICQVIVTLSASGPITFWILPAGIISIMFLIAKLAGSLFALSKKIIQTKEEHSKFYSINDFFDDISDKYKSIVKKSIPSDYALDIEKWMNTLESETKEKISEYFRILKNVIVNENLKKNWVRRKVSELIGKIKEFVKSDYYDWASTDAKGIIEIFENILSKLFKIEKYQDYPSFGSE
jgi:hypothetical protein